MKKIINVVTIVAVLMSCTTSRVQSQPPYERNRDNNYYSNQGQRSFDYYPSANVYYDASCKSYIYNNGRSWITAAFLPPGIFIGRSPSYPVYCNGPEIWRDNDIHRNRYNGQAYNQRPYDDQYGNRDRDRNWGRDRDRGRDWSRGGDRDDHRDRRQERRYNY